MLSLFLIRISNDITVRYNVNYCEYICEFKMSSREQKNALVKQK